MRTLLLAAAAILIAGLAQAQSFTYTTIDNPADPTFNQLLGINDHGVIAGYFGSGAAGHPNQGYTIAGPYTAFRNFAEPGSVQTQATGINNAGLITGFWSNTNQGNNQDANFGLLAMPVGKTFNFLAATDPLVAGQPRIAQALGVNNNNLAVGFYLDANGNSHGYTFNSATATYQPVNVAGSQQVVAAGINDAGETCGSYVNRQGNTVGFTRNASGGVVATFHVPGTNFTQLLGINNSGIAVGWYTDAAGIAHGLYYNSTNGAWLSVNDPNGVGGTVVNGLNNQGQLVGFYTDAAGNVHGMLVTVSP